MLISFFEANNGHFYSGILDHKSLLQTVRKHEGYLSIKRYKDQQHKCYIETC